MRRQAVRALKIQLKRAQPIYTDVVRLSFSVRRRPRERQRGAYAVEFSLVLLPLLLLTIGTIDVGRMVVSRGMLSYAAICGARAGVVKATTTAAMAQTAVTAAAPMLALSSAVVTTSAASWAGRGSGDTVTAVATYTFQPVLPVMTRLVTKNFTATSTITIP